MKDFIKHIENLLTKATGRPCTAFVIGNWYLYTNVPRKAKQKAIDVVMKAYPFGRCIEEDRQWHKDFITLRFVK